MGEPIAQGSRLKIRLTHQNLANAIGTTRVTVTRLLGEFQRQGAVSIDGDRHLIIHD
jgi:CRP-like cAMP-binding protein